MSVPRRDNNPEVSPDNDEISPSKNSLFGRWNPQKECFQRGPVQLEHDAFQDGKTAAEEDEKLNEDKVKLEAIDICRAVNLKDDIDRDYQDALEYSKREPQ